MRLMSLVFSILAGAAVAFPGSAAGDAGGYYAGRTITIVVGYGAGGGYDAFARLVAPELEKLTQATVLVRNRPGGGGLVALNEATRAGSDGLTLTLVNVSAAVTAQLLDSEAARFRVTDLVWAGGIESDPRVLLLPSGKDTSGWTSPRQSPAPIRWAAGGRTDNLALSAALISESMHLASRIITGYRGTSEAIAALLRGEADAVVVSVESAAPVAGPDTVSMAALLARERAEALAGIPTIYEIAGPDADRTWLDRLVRLATLGRAFILPPDTPDDRVALVRDALARILTDRAFIDAAKSLGRTMVYASPQDLAEAVGDALLEADPQERARFIAVARDKYF